MQTTVTTKSTNPKKISSEIYDRILIGLFIFLCWRLTAYIFKPITDGDTKLILVSLVEVAMIIIMDLRFSRSNICKDLNEFNCYGLLIHLFYLPLYYIGVSPIYHNSIIQIMLCLVAIRLIYFGPRTENGDFTGLPTFGLLGYIQSRLKKSNNSTIARLSTLMPFILFFGAIVPLGIIIARTSDFVIAFNTIGLMIFIFAMSMQFQKLLAESRRASIVYTQQDAVAVPTKKTESVRDLSSLVIEAYRSVHPSVQPLLAATNIHLARAFNASPAGLAISMKEQRAAILQNLSDIMMIAQMQSKYKDEVDYDLGLRIDFAFEQIFSDELRTETVKTYAKFANDAALGAGDTQLFLACDALVMAWLRVIFHADNKYMESADILKEITEKVLTTHKPHYPIEED